jgi:hypothetical protein
MITQKIAKTLEKGSSLVITKDVEYINGFVIEKGSKVKVFSYDGGNEIRISYHDITEGDLFYVSLKNLSLPKDCETKTILEITRELQNWTD